MSKETMEPEKLNIKGVTVGISPVISDLQVDRRTTRFVALLANMILSDGGKIMMVYHPIFSPLVIGEALRLEVPTKPKPIQILIDETTAAAVTSDDYFAKYYDQVAEVLHVKGGKKNVDAVTLDSVYFYLAAKSDVLVMVGQKPHDDAEDRTHFNLLLVQNQLSFPCYMVGVGSEFATPAYNRMVHKRPKLPIDVDDMTILADCGCDSSRVPYLYYHFARNWDFEEERKKKRDSLVAMPLK